MQTRQRTYIALAATALTLSSLVADAAAGRRVDERGVAVFTDGRTGQVRRVFTYKQADGVPAFTDRAPRGQKYEVMEFACYACDPHSKVEWRATDLYTDKYVEQISAASRHFGVDPALIRAVIHAESGFNPYAKSNRGASGLMQLMPGTAADMGVSDVYAVDDNIKGGVKYLSMLLGQYKGDVTLATAAYHAGPASVNRYGGIPPFPETQTYVERVNILRGRYKAKG